jgi:ethanolamine utilization protein EutA
VGGRLLAQDSNGAWTRIDDSARQVAQALGMEASAENFAKETVRQAMAERLAQIVVDQIAGTTLDALGQALALTEPLDRSIAPQFLTFSGGVAEYIFQRESASHGDIAKPLAEEIVKQLQARISIPVIEPRERIRATVIGASQFTVQVSGKTIYLPDASVLPAHNIPVVHLGLDIEDAIDVDEVAAAFVKNADLLDIAPTARLALALNWRGEPDHARLLAMAQAIMQFAAPAGIRGEVLFLMINGDVGASLGRLLHDELHLDGQVVSIDGIELQALDFVDVGELLDPPGVVPVVIKSLLFPGHAPGD